MKRILFLQRGIFNTLVIVLLLSMLSCKKETIGNPNATTLNVVNITSTTAQCGGAVSGKKITQKGVCWNRNGNPTIDDAKTQDGSGDASYISEIRGLLPAVNYYLRAYAINESGIAYGEERTFSTIQGSLGNMTDIDGNVYKTVFIAGKEWMAENLKVTHYRDGSSVEFVTTDGDWITKNSGAYCNYKFVSSDYGKLYNWHVTQDNRNIAPLGWHVPTLAEWDDMINSIGGYSVTATCAKLRDTGSAHWTTNSNAIATNESNFSAYGAGHRNFSSGGYYNLGESAFFWARDFDTFSRPFFINLDNNNNLSKTSGDGRYGFSIRCVKD